MNLIETIMNSKIYDIRFVRGLGIIPARFEIEIGKNDVHYLLQSEVNLRIISKNKLILCFDDIFLDKNLNEITLKKYREQKNIENTILEDNIKKSLETLIGKNIISVKLKKYGDVEIKTENNVKIQFINDTHLLDSCILRITTKEKQKEILLKNGDIYKSEKVLLELKNGKNGPIIDLI